MSAPAQSGLTLEKLSGFTLIPAADLQKLVPDYLPKPRKGIFPTTESLKGAFRFYREALDRPITVNKDELRELTGLSDQRHRQLAEEAHFPAPIKGRYLLKETAAGIIRYFKELHQRRDRTLGQKRERKLDNENLYMEMRNGRALEQIVDDFCASISPALTECRQLIYASKLSQDEANELIASLGRIIDDALKHKRPGPTADKAEDSANPDPAAEAERLAMG